MKTARRVALRVAIALICLGALSIGYERHLTNEKDIYELACWPEAKANYDGTHPDQIEQCKRDTGNAGGGLYSDVTQACIEVLAGELDETQCRDPVKCVDCLEFEAAKPSLNAYEGGPGGYGWLAVVCGFLILAVGMAAKVLRICLRSAVATLFFVSASVAALCIAVFVLVLKKTAFLTVPITFVAAFLQLVASGIAAWATRQAARAANDSAKTAESALRAVRPYILLDKLQMRNFEPRTRLASSSTQTVADVTLTNAGNGPAIITKIVARMKLTARPFPSNEPPDFSDCQEMWAWWITPNVIASKGVTNFVVRLEGGNLPDESYYQLKTHDNIALALYGVITYEDVFEGIYETTFGYLYSWGYNDTSEGVWGFQVVAPEYNRHRQIKRKENEPE